MPDDRPADPAPTRSRGRLTARRLRLLWWRARPVVAAGALAVAAVAALHELRPPPPPTHDVVVLADAAPAGTRLAAAAVTVRAVPRSTVPDGALTSTSEAVGQRLVAGLPAGTVLSPGLLAGPGVAARAPVGTVVVPVRLADAAVAELLGAGDVVDLLSSPVDGPGEASVLARRALVLAREAGEGSGALLAGDDGAPLLLVAVPQRAATLLSGAGTWGPLSAVLVPP